ncbi:hypothetical protein J4429_06360 [Candidatus Pacearchaeota archaeon]|nr:hypothetical protein [Candidatus Pacearchaeota archaeon]
MASIRKLEKMLKPYNIGGAFSSEFTQYNEYQREEVKARLDEIDILPWGKITYKEVLEKAAKELGLI